MYEFFWQKGLLESQKMVPFWSYFVVLWKHEFRILGSFQSTLNLRFHSVASFVCLTSGNTSMFVNVEWEDLFWRLPLTETSWQMLFFSADAILLSLATLSNDNYL